MSGKALAAAAEALEGTPFRLHGRDPRTGLDCVGVLFASLAAIGRSAPLPNGYSLRSHRVAGLSEIAERCGFSDARGQILPGDAMLVRMGPCQFHLLLAGLSGRIVHAHAGVKRVILCDGPPLWPIVGRWRLTQANEVEPWRL